MNSYETLKNRIALVTGSAKGIGREIALQLAQRGADVVLNYRTSQTEAEALKTRIESLGRRALAVQADVSRVEQAESLIHQVLKHFGRLDILVNNAGPFVMHTIAETSIEEWHQMLDGNLNSAFYCTRFALPVMRKQKSGHVIFIGNIKADSLRARHNSCAYGIAKTGVLLLAKTLAREEGPHGIRANVVNPGIIDTGNLEGNI